VQAEAAPLRLAGQAQVAHLQQHRAALGALLRVHVRQLAAHHHPDHVRRGGLGGDPRADVAAVAQNRDPVGEGEDLAQLVADVQDAHPFSRQAAQQVKERGRFVLGQGGGRLVQDEDFALHGERLGDLDELLVGHGERADLGAGIDGHVEPGQVAAGVLEQFAILDHAQPVGGQAAGVDVLGHRQGRDHAQLLVDDGDPQGDRVLRAAQGDGLPLEEDLAGVGGVHAGEDLHQRAFAGAVLPDHGVNLAGLQLQLHIVQRQRARKLLGNAFGFK